ncbi:MAG: hypothetical protein CSA97_05270 [Bacteroidetes bacterium]|nr:MAG: hypothetical protein CSA97_05270 [Bacteroidota bacterium]
MPRLSAFSRQCLSFANHRSGSNGTRSGVFTLFYGLPATYFEAMERTGKRPVLVDKLLQEGYTIRTYPSANMYNPPLKPLMFHDIPGVIGETQGGASYLRDMQLTRNACAFLDTAATTNQPFFAFLFYDALHAFDLPDSLNHPYKPTIPYANWLELDNDSDPMQLLNLYRNSAHLVDSLAGIVLDRLQTLGMLENTLVLITGDHAQEFNDNQQNYWGHNGNFTDAQIKVPLLLYEPAMKGDTVIARPTSHYDLAPTLMHRLFACKSPDSLYSAGSDLLKGGSPEFLVLGATGNWAIRHQGYIYELNVAGELRATDSCLRPTERPLPLEIFQAAQREMSRFYLR